MAASHFDPIYRLFLGMVLPTEIYAENYLNATILSEFFFLIQTATRVSEFNVTALMHEIMTEEKYVLPKTGEKKKEKKGKATLQEVTEEEKQPEEKEEVKEKQDIIAQSRGE